MACNMTGGSSGGPWIADSTNPGTIEGKVASLNSYGYSGLTVMFGPKFTSDTARRPADGDQRHVYERHGGAEPAVDGRRPVTG